METHPVTELFPLMAGKDYEKLVADIREHGLREPIWLHPDGRIIDGRNRWRACEDAGVEPQTREWDGEGSLTAFVVSLNLHRRHLTSSQRAAAAAEALPMLKAEARERQREGGRTKLPQKIAEASPEGKGSPRRRVTEGKDNVDGLHLLMAEGIEEASSSIPPDKGEATERAAKMFGTNREYVRVAARLKDEAPDIFAAVKTGEITVNQQQTIRDYVQLHPEINRRVASLDLGAKDLLALANLGKSVSACTEAYRINAALDIFEPDKAITIKEAVAQVRRKMRAEEEELKQRLEETQKRSDEETEREWREREPFEFFAEFLVDMAYLDVPLQNLQRHIKNCGLKKLQAAIDKRLAEIEAQYESERISQAAAEAAETAEQKHSPAS